MKYWQWIYCDSPILYHHLTAHHPSTVERFYLSNANNCHFQWKLCNQYQYPYKTFLLTANKLMVQQVTAMIKFSTTSFWFVYLVCAVGLLDTTGVGALGNVTVTADHKQSNERYLSLPFIRRYKRSSIFSKRMSGYWSVKLFRGGVFNNELIMIVDQLDLLFH